MLEETLNGWIKLRTSKKKNLQSERISYLDVMHARKLINIRVEDDG